VAAGTAAHEAVARAAMRTEAELLYELKTVVDQYPTDAAAAKAFGISRGHLSRVLRGLKPITANLASCLGYEEQKRYVRYEERG
jgi:hypothetical protein